MIGCDTNSGVIKIEAIAANPELPKVPWLAVATTLDNKIVTAQAPQRTSTALDLEHGSLLLMRGASQRDYEHCLTKTRRRVDGRINLTFRYVHDSVVSR